MGSRPKLILISAMTRDRVIGRRGALPWDIPAEYEHFLRSVRGNTVLIGRKSYEIFGPDLADSRLIVVSRTRASLPDAEVCGDVATAVERARSRGRTVFVAGGAAIYRETLPLADEMHLSIVKGDHEGDALFPPWDGADWELTLSEERGAYEFRAYRRRPGA